MTTVQDILQKVKTLEIKSKKLTNALFTGEYHTAFRGRGMNFKEVKEYSAGDDPRFIDWNVSARLGNTYSKVFEEERELNVYLLVDVSASTLFGSIYQTKQELITEICAVLAFSALNNHDKVSLLFFSEDIEKYIPSKKGREHVLYLVKELLSFQPKQQQTNIAAALRYINSISRQKSIVFILSDFADAGYESLLKVTAKKHDVIGIQIADSTEAKLPNIGLVEVEDIETGQTILLDTSDTMVRYHYQNQYIKIQADAAAHFQKAGASLIQLSTADNYIQALQKFFLKRS